MAKKWLKKLLKNLQKMKNLENTIKLVLIIKNFPNILKINIIACYYSYK